MKKIPTAPSKPPDTKSSITVRMSADLKEWVKQSADAADLNSGQFVRRAITSLREQEEARK